MEQLIFVGIILLFSILEAVARKGRAKQGGEEAPPLPEEPHQRRPRAEPRHRGEPHPGTVPRSYDEDPSFDEAARGDEARYRPEPAAREAPAAEAPRSRTGSEGLIPADVWDEIQRMARGELPGPQQAPPPLPAPRPAPPPRRPVEDRAPETRSTARPRPSRPKPSGKAKPTQRAGASTAQARTGKALGRPAEPTPEAAPAAEGTTDHPVHLAHQAFGTAPSQRAGIPLEGRPAVDRATALRKLLLSEQRDSLRHAVVLQEVLGPPPGLRERER